jgi:hypothetical protein
MKITIEEIKEAIRLAEAKEKASKAKIVWGQSGTESINNKAQIEAENELDRFITNLSKYKTFDLGSLQWRGIFSLDPKHEIPDDNSIDFFIKSLKNDPYLAEHLKLGCKALNIELD